MVVRSWDVFDTIIARRCLEPNNVFNVMAQQLGFPNYLQLRKTAEHTSSDRTLPGIYRNVQKMTNIKDEMRDQLLEIELATEAQQAFIIPEIYDQIADGDLLISDMYMDAGQILQLLKRVGFDKRVEVFASYGGKNQGTVWGELAARGLNISEHTGDNYHSDVVSPHRNGILGRHYAGAAMSATEQLVQSAGFPQLARLMRTTRLMNPYKTGSIDHRMWNEQAQLNGPILYLSSLHLNLMVKERAGADKLLFLTRDGVHWHQLYKKLFPSDEAYYFHSSRTMSYQPTPSYLNYIAAFGDPSRLLFVDLFGTGNSIYNLFSKHLSTFPFYYAITSPAGEPTFNPMLRASGRSFVTCENVAHSQMELLNYDTIGTLIDFTESGPVRGPPLHGAAHLGTYHGAMARFLAEIPKFARDPVQSEAQLVQLVQRLYQAVERGVAISHLVQHDPQWLMRVPNPRPVEQQQQQQDTEPVAGARSQQTVAS